MDEWMTIRGQEFTQLEFAHKYSKLKISADSVLNFKIEMDNVVYIFSGKRKQQRNLVRKLA